MAAATIEELVSDIGRLEVPDAHELGEYEAHIQAVIADVDRAVLDHPRFTEVLGGNPSGLALSNHRNHAGFMAELFRTGTLEDLPATAVWAYRAYTSQGVHPDYWTIHLPAWEASFTAHGVTDNLARVTTVYRWLAAHHHELLTLSQKPAPAPLFASETSASFADRLAAFDLRGSLAIVEEALDGGAPITAILTDLIDPALQLVGAQWEDGVFTSAHEHRATAIADRVIAGLLAQADIGALRGGTVLVTAAESEFHDLGALSIAIYFEAAGWDVTYLGANTPNQDVADLAAELDPAVVAVSVTIPGHLPSVRHLVNTISGTTAARTLVGGGLFKRIPTLTRNVDADLVTFDPVEAIRWANEG